MKKGFTLIELLVVIAIVGGLVTLVVPNLMAARERARDVQRKSDLKQMQKAIELYKQDQNPVAVPTSTSNVFGTACGSAFVNGTTTYFNKTPCDPKNPTPTPYYYNAVSGSLNYTLCACLENKADTDGTSGNCSGAYTCSSNKKYEVTQP